MQAVVIKRLIRVPFPCMVHAWCDGTMTAVANHTEYYTCFLVIPGKLLAFPYSKMLPPRNLGVCVRPGENRVLIR